MSLANPIPILRIFDEIKAKEFYIDFLGFKIDWQHRFEPDTPIYFQISKEDCVMHLSEHHGDSCPGASLRIETSELNDYHITLNDKKYRNARPGIQETPWGTRDMKIADPFGNHLIFCEENQS